MRILFIYPNMYSPIAHSPALQAISAVLKSEGHKVGVIHINNENGVVDNDAVILQDIKEFNPDIIGFTCTSFEFTRSNQIAGYLKSHGIKVPIILGGVHATIAPHEFNGSNFDAFVVGDGEIVFSEMAKGLLEAKGIIHGKPVEDINTLPMTDWDLLDMATIIGTKNGWLNLPLSRGCPYKCTFCGVPRIHEAKNYYIVRRKNVDKIVEELKYLVSKFPVKVFNFDDDLFTLNFKWLMDFTSAYKKEIYDVYGIQYCIESRLDTLVDVTAKALADSGCREIQFGLETGSQKLLDFVKKQLNYDKIVKGFGLCRKYGIRSYAYIIFGIPGEDESTLNDTISLIAKVRPTLLRPTFLIPVKGTDLFDYCQKNGLFNGKEANVWNFEPVLNLPTISNDTLMRYWMIFPWYLNAEMGIKEYEDEIKKYEGYSYNQLCNAEAFNMILDKDIELSEKYTSMGIEHYRYHQENRVKEKRNISFNRYQLVSFDAEENTQENAQLVDAKIIA
ncbi:B12-binding domain-containing radical SAM protein [Candidatus Woesearchaeota archaeon]|nr:B12-binding domain-containing radical SAM protein [Candidatus Woesearchaeota archaeon]